jgi:dTDP-glucose 4,6-dehydratase
LDHVKPEATKYEEKIAYVPDRSGLDVGYAIDACKSRKELNWLPIETFESAIRKKRNDIWTTNDGVSMSRMAVIKG